MIPFSPQMILGGVGGGVDIIQGNTTRLSGVRQLDQDNQEVGTSVSAEIKF